jgi:hypothetical protein
MKRTTHIYVLAVVGLSAIATVVAVTRAGAAPTTHHVRGSAGTPRAGYKSRINDSRAAKVVQSLQANHLDDAQAWEQPYGSRWSSAQASPQSALQGDHARETRDAPEQAGVSLPVGLRTRDIVEPGEAT